MAILLAMTSVLDLLLPARLGGVAEHHRSRGAAPAAEDLEQPGAQALRPLRHEGDALPVVRVFVSSSGFQLRQRFFSHVARKGFRFGKGVPLSLFGFAS